MPFGRPPDNYPGEPNRYRLPEGSQLWRVQDQRRGAAEFKRVPADKHFGGGRFDATDDDPYPYLYAAVTATTALAETLVRSLPFGRGRQRILPRKAVAGRRLCLLEVTAELRLVSLLTHADLSAVKQDEWLVQSDPRDYAFTRRWAHWLRSQAPWAQGLIWSSRRDLGEQSVVLFGDRCPDQALRAVSPDCQDLDDLAGAASLNALLAPYRVQIRPPRAASCTPPPPCPTD
jgi:hypothetical protein